MSGTDREFSPPAEAGASLTRPAQGPDPAGASRKPNPAGANDAANIEVDARIVAEGLGIAPEDVEPGRLAGSITTLCERGTGEDAGLIRATFYLGKRRLRLVVDAEGRVVQHEPTPDQPAT